MPPHKRTPPSGSAQNTLASGPIADVHGSGPVLATIAEPDPLVRLIATQAAGDLGFTIGGGTPEADIRDNRPAVLFVGLDHLSQCARCAPRADGSVLGDADPSGALDRPPKPFTVGYVAGPHAILTAHSVHACTDLVVALRALDGRPAFVYAADDTVGKHASLLVGLTPREADVLLYVLGSFSTSMISGRLRVSPATVRSHCRSILRKCGAANRRVLRARLLDVDRPAFAKAPCLGWSDTVGIPLADDTELRERTDS